MQFNAILISQKSKGTERPTQVAAPVLLYTFLLIYIS